MKRILNQLKKRLLPGKLSKASKKQNKKDKVELPPVLLPIDEVAQMREIKLAHLRATCDEVIAKLRNGEKLTPYDQARTQIAIQELINSRFNYE
ncbi:hypothetical protein [Microscilla marina]|uniref:Uncharacterized protein n=1 Tax=Microscilla marina ATCC 23134 TaxID=313606 RepID=A1ZJA0_MICM2|nr:hypothetical protein [Microscilla marina]EAY29636.1 hypothetical protein M23134_00520 [Microscilla marina ATCC 23134]